jgi:hypothetical protein
MQFVRSILSTSDQYLTLREHSDARGAGTGQALRAKEETCPAPPDGTGRRRGGAGPADRTDRCKRGETRRQPAGGYVRVTPLPVIRVTTITGYCCRFINTSNQGLGPVSGPSRHSPGSDGIVMGLLYDCGALAAAPHEQPATAALKTDSPATGCRRRANCRHSWCPGARAR